MAANEFGSWSEVLDALEACRAEKERLLAEVRGVLTAIPWKPEYAGEAMAGIYRALSIIEDALGLPDEERQTATLAATPTSPAQEETP